MNFIKCGLLLTASALQPYYNSISEIRKTVEKENQKIRQDLWIGLHLMVLTTEHHDIYF